MKKYLIERKYLWVKHFDNNKLTDNKTKKCCSFNQNLKTSYKFTDNLK